LIFRGDRLQRSGGASGDQPIWARMAARVSDLRGFSGCCTSAGRYGGWCGGGAGARRRNFGGSATGPLPLYGIRGSIAAYHGSAKRASRRGHRRQKSARREGREVFSAKKLFLAQTVRPRDPHRGPMEKRRPRGMGAFCRRGGWGISLFGTPEARVRRTVKSSGRRQGAYLSLITDQWLGTCPRIEAGRSGSLENTVWASMWARNFDLRTPF